MLTNKICLEVAAADAAPGKVNKRLSVTPGESEFYAKRTQKGDHCPYVSSIDKWSAIKLKEKENTIVRRSLIYKLVDSCKRNKQDDFRKCSS